MESHLIFGPKPPKVSMNKCSFSNILLPSKIACPITRVAKFDINVYTVEDFKGFLDGIRKVKVWVFLRCGSIQVVFIFSCLLFFFLPERVSILALSVFPLDVPLSSFIKIPFAKRKKIACPFLENYAFCTQKVKYLWDFKKYYTNFFLLNEIFKLV